MKKKKIAITTLTIAVWIVIAVGITVAWFINYGTNKAEGTSVTVSSGAVMEISLNGTDFSNTTSKSDFDTKSLNMTDVTGDGSVLYRPALADTSNDDGTTTASPEAGKEWKTAKSTLDCEKNEESDYANAQYIELTIYFRAASEMDVYLSSESTVLPVNTDPKVNTSAYASDGSEFTTNYIAAASRVAFVDKATDENTSDTVKFIWAPLPNVELLYQTTGTTKGYTLITNSSSIQTYAYQSKMEEAPGYKTIFFKNLSSTDKTPSDGANNYSEISFFTSLTTNTGSTNSNEIPVTRLTKSTDGSSYYYGSTTMKLWIEGTDREARRALAGGEIAFSLVFVGKPVQTGDSQEG